MHPSVIRHINASRIFHAIRLEPNMSQREIAAKTGADKSTVSAVIKDFEANGLIVRATRNSDNRPGRPGEQISISPRGGLLAGVHPNPEGVLYVLSGLDGEPIAHLTRPLPKDPLKLGKEIALGIRQLTSEVQRRPKEVRAVGISVPGLVSTAEVLTQSPNLSWSEVAIGAELGESLKYPFYVDNNANASTIAEFYFGRATEIGDFAYIESGSGVGLGLFLDGSIYRGVGGFAGEFGHMKIVPEGRICRCGAQGCVSAYTSDYSIFRRLEGRGITVESRAEVLALAQAGNEIVLKTLEDAGWHLGVGLSNVLNLLNLPLFILGGGVDEFEPYMRKGTWAALRELALPSVLAGCRIERSSLAAGRLPLGGIALALEGCTSPRDQENTPW